MNKKFKALAIVPVSAVIMRLPVFVLCMLLYPGLTTPLWAKENQTNPNEKQIIQAIIQESIATYPGNCPCPYNVARNGSHCGGRSAYSRAGGYSPICFPGDVTPAMVATYKRAHHLK